MKWTTDTFVLDPVSPTLVPYQGLLCFSTFFFPLVALKIIQRRHVDDRSVAGELNAAAESKIHRLVVGINDLTRDLRNVEGLIPRDVVTAADFDRLDVRVRTLVSEGRRALGCLR